MSMYVYTRITLKVVCIHKYKYKNTQIFVCIRDLLEKIVFQQGDAKCIDVLPTITKQ